MPIEACSPPNIDLSIATQLAQDNPAPEVCQYTQKELEQLLGGWLPGQWPEISANPIDSPSSFSELEITNLCQSPGAFCWLESNPDNPNVKKLYLKLETPKNFDWFMASMKAILLPLKVEFNDFSLRQNFTNPLVAPDDFSSQNWDQEIRTSLFTKLDFDVVVKNNLDMIILKTTNKNTLAIPLDQFIHDVIDHPCSQPNPQENCQLELQKIASRYPTGYSFTYGLSPDQSPTKDQAVAAMETADESGEFTEVNDHIRLYIKDGHGNIIGEVIIPLDNWQSIQDSLKTEAEKRKDMLIDRGLVALRLFAGIASPIILLILYRFADKRDLLEPLYQKLAKRK